ncbi:MAG: hypothetical protein ACYS0C_02305 [Planctomycetota bacterium]|jgi:hypothetical protein
MKKRLCNRFFVVAALLYSLTIIGCAVSNFTASIGKFQESMNKSSATLGTYYREVNNFERDVYLVERLSDPNLKVFTRENGKRTPILGQFSEESIQARLDALTLLGIYGERLAEIAGSDAPARFAEGATVLGENLTNLGNRFNQLSRKRNDATALSYAGPIGTIVGLVGQTFLEAKRANAVKQAVREGAPAVRKILDLLEKDISDRILLIQTTGARQILENRINFYNENRHKMKRNERRKALEDINIAAKRCLLVQSSSPIGLVQSIRETHEALIIYANSDSEQADLARFISALELFTNRAREISIAVQQFREIRSSRL